ncbi:MAG: hypothetical protein Q7S34_02490 [bacterium]|nr:hypothetical protein [bacterium]
MAANPQDVMIRELDIVTFKKFLAQRNIGDEAAVVPLLKEAWNQAVESVSTYFGSQEGTDFGAYDALTVK